MKPKSRVLERGWGRLLALLLLLCCSSPSVFAIWWTEPGSGTHPFPDPRDPRPSPGPTPSPTPTPPPLPESFIGKLKALIKFSEDVAAMRAWFSTLTPAEQERHAAEMAATQGKLKEMEALVQNLVFEQLDKDEETRLYLLMSVVRQLSIFRARGVFLPLITTISQRVFNDYLQDPSNVTRLKRARDMQALRVYIGYSAGAPPIPDLPENP